MAINNSYMASAFVRSMHNLPHLNRFLEVENSQFNISYGSSKLNSYTQSLFPLPIIIGIIGVLLVLLLQCTLCCKRFCSCCKTKNIKTPPFLPLAITFSVLLCFTLAANQVLIYGNLSLSSGVTTTNNALSYLSDTFNDLTTYGNTLNSNGNIVVADFKSALTSSCDTQPLIDTMNDNYFPNINLYYDEVSPISSDCDNGSNLLSYYGTSVKNEVIWALYGLMTVGVLLYSVGLLFKNKLTLQIAIAVSELLLLLFFTVCTGEMIGLMALGDFCMDPIPNMLSSLSPSGSTYGVFSYYSTCQGTNPFATYLNTSQQAVQDLIRAVDTYYLPNPACASGYNALNMSVGTMHAIEGVFSSINAEIVCPPLNSQLVDVLQTGLCQQVFLGFYSIWISQYSSNSCLFFATVVICVVFYNFGRYWGRADEEEDSFTADACDQLAMEDGERNGMMNEYSPRSSLYDVNSSGSTSRQQPSRIIYSNNSSVYSMNSDTRGDGYGGGIVGSTSPMSRMSNVMPSSSGEEYPTAVIIDDATRGSIDNPNASHWQRQRALKN